MSNTHEKVESIEPTSQREQETAKVKEHNLASSQEKESFLFPKHEDMNSTETQDFFTAFRSFYSDENELLDPSSPEDLIKNTQEEVESIEPTSPSEQETAKVKEQNFASSQEKESLLFPKHEDMNSTETQDFFTAFRSLNTSKNKSFGLTSNTPNKKDEEDKIQVESNYIPHLGKPNQHSKKRVSTSLTIRKDKRKPYFPPPRKHFDTTEGAYWSYSKSIEQKQHSNQIAEFATVDRIGNFQDIQIAEILQRLTGVNVYGSVNNSPNLFDGVGEGKEATLRGMLPHFNRTTFNGQMLASNTFSSGTRAFNYNTLSPKLLSGIEIIKTPNAKMDEGSIGATVNLKTTAPLDLEKKHFSSEFLGSRHSLAEDYSEKYSLLYADKFADNQLGLLLNFTHLDAGFRCDSFVSSGYKYISFDSSNNKISDEGNPSLVVTPDPTLDYGYMPQDYHLNLRLEDHEKSCFNGTIQFNPYDSLEFKLEYLFSYLKKKTLASKYFYRFTDTPGSINNTLIESVVLDGDDFVAVTNSSSTNNNHQRNYVALFNRHDRHQTQCFSFITNWIGDYWTLASEFGGSNGKGKGDPGINASFGKQSDLSYDRRGVKFATLTSSSDFEDLSEYTWKSLSSNFRLSKDQDHFAQIDVERLFNSNIIKSIEFGGKYRHHTKKLARSTDDSVTKVGSLENYTNSELFPVNSFSLNGGLPDEWAVPSPDLIYEDYSLESGGELGERIIRPKQDYSSNWDLTERITSAYMMANHTSKYCSGNLGVRFVNTVQSARSLSVHNDTTLIPTTQNDSYFEVLPSFNSVFYLHHHVYLKGSVARVISRPALELLTQGYNINEDDLTATRGNPKLSPYSAIQYDLSLECYFKGSLLSTAAFYKDLDLFIVTNQKSEVIPGFELDDGNNPQEFLVSYPDHGKTGRIAGAELTYEVSFSKYPSFWGGFGLAFNYTFLDSSTPNKDPFGKRLPLEGVSQSTFNTSLLYEKYNLNTVISYTTRSKFLLYSTSLAGLPIYNKSYSLLDAFIDYNFWNTGLTLSLKGMNLCNEPLVTYADKKSRIISHRSFGRRFFAGLNYSINW